MENGQRNELALPVLSADAILIILGGFALKAMHLVQQTIIHP